MSLPIKILAFSIVLILGLALGYFTLRNYAIETLLEKAPTKPNLLALGKLAPGNAYIEAALGRLFQFSAEDYDLHEAITHYLRASTVNPYDASTWQNLGKAYESIGEISKARQALQNATLASPSSASAHWSLANFLVRNPESSGGADVPSASLPNAPNQTELAQSAKDPAAASAGRIRQMVGGASTEKTEQTERLNRLFLFELNRTISLDPTVLPDALGLAARAGIDPALTFEESVPKTIDAQLAATYYYAKAKDWTTAAIAWHAIEGSALPFEIEQPLPYIDALISDYRIDEAVAVWSSILKKTYYLEGTATRPALDYSPPTTYHLIPIASSDTRHLTPDTSSPDPDQNLIFNATFSRDPLNGGFDWRVFDTHEAPIRIDKEVYLKGRRSIRVEFSGKQNLDFGHIEQLVPVRPSTSYNFSAWVKGEDLTTDQGPFFEIAEVISAIHNPQSEIPRPQSFHTIQALGTNEWKELGVSFKTGPSTQLLLVRLRRLPSSKFDNLIKGRLWLGSVQLTEQTR